MGKTETMEEFLARGGKVQHVDASAGFNEKGWNQHVNNRKPEHMRQYHADKLKKSLSMMHVTHRIDGCCD